MSNKDNVLPFPYSQTHDLPEWTKEDRATFYRLHAALTEVGATVELDFGRSDEGDPWFALTNAASGETLVHCIRQHGNYLAFFPAKGLTISDAHLQRLLERLMRPLFVSCSADNFSA